MIRKILRKIKSLRTPRVVPVAKASGLRYADICDGDMSLIVSVSPHTMTSIERRIALTDAIRHVVKNRIPGAVVECGVWKGGSMLLAAKLLASMNSMEKSLYLYDTFEGMPPPTAVDCDQSGMSAAERLERDVCTKGVSHVWAISGLDDVKAVMKRCDYPADKIKYVIGRVEDTIPDQVPSSISVLRLDTDWYESTCHELQYLYPLVSPGGLVIIDDYGYWSGARRAVDEFLSTQPQSIFLNRIDETGRIFQKPVCKTTLRIKDRG